MMRITWDDLQDRAFTSGVSQGVLFPGEDPGVPWNGLISVTETEDMGKDPKYFDGLKYVDRNVLSAFSGIITAYTYPDELEPYIGMLGAATGQPRQSFGFTYRTNREIHIVYNVLTLPSKADYETLNEKPIPVSFEWAFTTQPEKIPGGKPSSHLVIRVDDSHPGAISDLEDAIYGNDDDQPSLPEPADVLEIFESNAIMRITDNGDGTFTASGPDDMVSMIDATTFQITSPTAIVLDANTWRVSTY